MAGYLGFVVGCCFYRFDETHGISLRERAHFIDFVHQYAQLLKVTISVVTLGWVDPVFAERFLDLGDAIHHAKCKSV